MENKKSLLIVLYGTSEAGKVQYKYLASGYPDAVFMFCQTEKLNDFFEGVPVISLKELYSMDRNTIHVYVYDDIESLYEKRERLLLAGFANIFSVSPGLESFWGIIRKVPYIKEEMVSLFEELFLFIYSQEVKNRLVLRKYNAMNILTEIVQISDAYNLLEDRESQKTFCDILRYRISGNREFLKRRFVSPQYFLKDIFLFTDSEVFVDGGAAQGDSVLNFINFVDGKYEKIYAFEAKKTYCIGMDALFQNDKKVQIVKKGLYSHEGVLYFHENEHGSFVSDKITSTNSINVTSIDNCIDERVTFIKMDIEGSEMKALDGAKNTIQKYKPKLAICVYHLTDDLWKIPLKIKEILPEYKIYIRHHHEEIDEETVCYATV